MPKKQKRILLAMGWYDHRLHDGIARYAVEHGWHLCPDTTREMVVPWGWEGDGILAWLGAGDELADFVVKSRKPTVDFSFRRPQLKFPRMLMDHAGAARMVADHFLSRGFANFGFYSDTDNWSFEERGRAFLTAISKSRHKCDWLCWHRTPEFNKGRNQWKDKRRWLAAQLKRAPKPLALFAATDDHALEVLEICESIGLAVPGEVSIIGADNSLRAVEAMRTPISSVDMNMQTLGYRGAALLGELMRGRSSPRQPMRIPPGGLIIRKSSDLVAINHPGVAASLRFMLKHFHEPMGIENLVKVAHMSRRGLHQAFLERVGRPPGAELQRLRIEHAKRLLATSAHKLETIGSMCGYQSANSFWYAFKQATGWSPGEYRDQFTK